MAGVVRIYVVESACSRVDKSDVKCCGLTEELHLKLWILSTGEADGIHSVAEKCVDIRRNTSGEGGLLDSH